MPALRCPGWMYAATAAVLVAAGCAGETSPRKDRPADRAGTQYAGNRGDDALSVRVTDALAGDPTTDAIRVRVAGRHVRLSGFVDAPAEKWRAQQIARDVTGVETVENRVIVRSGVAANGPLARTWIHSP